MRTLPALPAFKLVHEVPNARLFHTWYRICGDAGFAPYELPGSNPLGQRVADSFEAGYDCVILENHGVVTGGVDTPREAFHRFETLEFAAKTIIKAKLLGGEIHFLTAVEELALEKLRIGQFRYVYA